MRHFIGFDVGGSHIKHGLITEEGEELSSDEFDTSYDAEEFKNAWKKVVETYQKEQEIAGIGISFPGYINPYTGEVPKAGALDFLDGVNLLEMFGELTDLPITIENDANCAALGEMWRGAGKSYESLVCITIGTGIGGGIILERQLLRGSHFRAGEFGVMPVGDNGENMHEIASARGLLEASRQALALPADAPLHGKEIFERMENDVHLREVVEKWISYLSRGIYSVVSMFDPEVVLIGGGVCQQQKLYPMLERALEKYTFWDALRVPIQPCELGNQAGRLGAVWQAVRKQ
ncbi:ROK family protein [Franconibacter helveticus 513]|uniref:ROK family protein n=1 Tax=Franconibacter helveticus TaxID=357240 RepID=UPI0003FB04F2|nr:ROK family protein [Franconibacter helveticus]MDU6926517.1 ROK family protein [Franconibacter helveticus]